MQNFYSPMLLSGRCKCARCVALDVAIRKLQRSQMQCPFRRTNLGQNASFDDNSVVDLSTKAI
jgi:hypothetical protein